MQPEGYQSFLFSMLDSLTSGFPQHQFLYIFDEPYPDTLTFRKNVSPVVVGSKTSNRLLLLFWLNYQVPVFLRRHKADVFLSMEGICSVRTEVPQCLLLSDIGFLQSPAAAKKTGTRFYKKHSAAFLAKAKAVATVSEYLKKKVAGNYKIPEERIAVIRPVVDEIYKPLGWEEQEMIREKYAGGKAYFLCNTNSNLINLLKAFTFFKKRQKSGMLLLITGNTDESFRKAFETYKLREEVKLLEDIDKTELAKLTAVAYAVVHPVLYDDIALPALQALQCRVPLVVSDIGSMPSVFGEAALYVNPRSFEDIAHNMMLVFKDEDRAKELVKAGDQLMQQYQAEKNTGLLMDCILKATNS